jgi:putative ABC transport system ATP-binding protein
MTALLQILFDALSLGSLYALGALGIALIFGVMRLVNFAHGDYISFCVFALLWPSIDAAANAAVPLIAKGMAVNEARERAKVLLEKLNILDQADKLPRQLSGGQQQRVAIARALVHEPRLVVCDEPTAALDARSGRRVMDLLREVAVAPDRACIIVTHDNRIFDLADRIIVLEDGRITHDGKDMPDDH